MTTYEQENKKYLKSIPYSNLKKGFLENINEYMVFRDLIDFLEDKNQKLLQQFMIKILSNEQDFPIEDLEEIFSNI